MTSITLLTPQQILAQANLGKLSTTAYNELSSTIAFPRGEMIKLKNNVIAKLDSYGSFLPSSLSSLKGTLQTTTPEQLSAALFAGGVAVKDFDGDNYDLSLESLTRLRVNIQAYYTLIAGGCELIRFALATSRKISEFSLEDFSLSELAGDLLGAVGDTLAEIAELAAKSVSQLVEDVVNLANNAYNAVYDAIKELASVTIKDIVELPKRALQAFVDVIDGVIAQIKQSINSLISLQLDVISICGINVKTKTTSTTENLQLTIENMDSTITDVSPKSLNKIKTILQLEVKRTKEEVSVIVLKRDELRMTTMLKKFQENNPEADEQALQNAAKQITAQAAGKRNDDIDAKTANIANTVNITPYILQDFKDKGKGELAKSATGGRKVANREEVIAAAKQIQAEKGIYDEDDFYPSAYVTNIATGLQSLHPEVRKRWAAGIKAFLEDYYEAGHDIKIASAFRTLEYQRQLFETGQSSTPYSWHCFGCAIDINIAQNGSFITRSEENQYMGWIRNHFQKYKLINPVRGDRNHFIPEELVGLSLKNGNFTPSPLCSKMLAGERQARDVVYGLLSTEIPDDGIPANRFDSPFLA